MQMFTELGVESVHEPVPAAEAGGTTKSEHTARRTGLRSTAHERFIHHLQGWICARAVAAGADSWELQRFSGQP